MRKAILSWCVLGCSALLSVGCSQNQQAAMPTPPSEEEMVAMMQEAATPAPQHKLLAPTVGTWKAVSHWRMSPEQPDEISTAVSHKDWAMNGLFVEETYEDKNSDHPFTGKGIYGYDKVANHFTSTWYDTMSSAVWQSTGDATENGKRIAYSGGGSCPMTGTFKEVRSELEIMNNNKHIYRMYDRTPEGKEFRSVEIVYERMKG